MTGGSVCDVIFTQKGLIENIKLHGKQIMTRKKRKGRVPISAATREIRLEKSALLKIRRKKKKAYELCFPNIFSDLFPNLYKLSKSGLKRKAKRILLRDRRLAVKKLLSMVKQADRRNDNTDSNNVQLPPNGVFSKQKFFFNKVITVRIKPNNVFCTFVNKANRKAISGTSSKYSVKMSKKTLKYNYKVVLKSFLKETKRYLKAKRILVSVTCPKRIRRDLYRILKNKLTRRKKFVRKASGKIVRYSPDLLLFRLHSKKCFNGCRARKKRRKKQRGLRVYK